MLLPVDDCQAAVLIGIFPDCRSLQLEWLLDLKHGLRYVLYLGSKQDFTECFSTLVQPATAKGTFLCITV